MALVGYKRPRTDSYSYSDSSNMQMVPSWQPNRGMIQPSGYARSSSMMSYDVRRNRRKGYRKFQNRSSYTRPVYPRPEVKFKDFVFGQLGALGSIDSAGSALNIINTISQGTSAGTRIGQQVATKSVYYQYVFNIGSVTAPIVIRHMLIWDKQPNGVVAVPADILSNTTSMVVSPNNLQNRDRFVTLADERLTLSPNGDQIKNLVGFRNINQLATYPDATATPTTGALLFFFVSDEAAGTSAPTCYCTWRLRYIDN